VNCFHLTVAYGKAIVPEPAALGSVKNYIF